MTGDAELGEEEGGLAKGKHETGGHLPFLSEYSKGMRSVQDKQPPLGRTLGEAVSLKESHIRSTRARGYLRKRLY